MLFSEISSKRKNTQFIFVYVGSIVICSQSAPEKYTIARELMYMYKLRVADQLSIFIGAELRWKSDGDGYPLLVSLTQAGYIEGILRRLGMEIAASANR